MRYKDIKEQRFGHLEVIEKSDRTDAKGRAYWICLCDCGRLLTVRGDQLRRGISTKCSECNGNACRPSRFEKEG